MNPQCSKDVHDTGRGVNFHQCPFKGVVQRDGRWYCRRHDPVEVEKRDKERHVRWDAEWNQERKHWARKQAAGMALELLEEKYLIGDIPATWKKQVKAIFAKRDGANENEHKKT